jgi:hypothetical protein
MLTEETWSFTTASFGRMLRHEKFSSVMITMSIFWLLVLVLFATSPDSPREQKVRNARQIL